MKRSRCLWRALNLEARTCSVGGSPDPESERMPGQKDEAHVGVPVWQVRSSRRDAPQFEHPPELDAQMRSLGDAALVEQWAKVAGLRRAERGERDEALEREVFARCLGYEELISLKQERWSLETVLEQWVHAANVPGGLAFEIVKMLRGVVVARRLALCVSNFKLEAFTSCSDKRWKTALKLLKAAGIVRRVQFSRTKPALLCPGPWWFEAKSVRGAPAEAGEWSPRAVSLDEDARARTQAVQTGA